ncbi:caspase, EACC1-associated type [Saccharothrix obliqua]|uniref:caspase, EACC1-associated type n=1 Tax=Saccharothrix obliqua TaxID=2861747 RepID=UPI001C5F5696|nr:caspase family protein [Saccharothrix obliqua]MBW4719568.1 caspase family protein [Saccharothrix obliqua]
MGRHALLVATGEYEDTGLSRLRAPAQDVERLAALLEDPDVGGFTDVRVLRDAADDEIRRAVADLVADRSGDDLVLLYFSCHGLTTPSRRLYFAAANTVRDRPAGTAVARSFVHEQLEDCHAAGRVLVLDCCFSGAFVEGFKAGDAPVVESGSGYVVLTASNAYEYAFEEDTLSLSAPRASLFTDVLIEGLASGAADLDGDGWVDVNEWSAYASREVRRRRPDQTPQFFAQSSGAALRVARASGVPVTVRQSASYTSGQLLVARGFRAAAEPVCRTLGPLGRRSVVFTGGRPVELGDSAAIAAAFAPDDPRDLLGASYVRELVTAVHLEAGDGAATAVAVAQGAITRLVEAMREGHNPVRLRAGVLAAAGRAAELIVGAAEPLADPVRLATAAAGDVEVGRVVGRAVDAAGRRGAVVVERGLRDGMDFTVTAGLRIEAGYASARFATDPVRRVAVIDDVAVGLFVGQLVDPTPVVRLAQERALLVLCSGLSDQALRELARREGVVAVVVDDEWLPGAQAVVGGHVLDADLVRAAGEGSLGHAARVVVTDRDTTIVADNARYADAATAAAVLRVDEDRVGLVERTVRAVRGAVYAGVLRGAGVGLAEVGATLAVEGPDGLARGALPRDDSARGALPRGAPPRLERGDSPEAAGWRAFASALAEPARRIAENSAVAVTDLDPDLIDSAEVALAATAGAARTAARFLLVA